MILSLIIINGFAALTAGFLIGRSYERVVLARKHIEKRINQIVARRYP